jgi:hypothetical protein
MRVDAGRAGAIVGRSASTAMAQCLNCSAALTDEYCAKCGQRRIHSQDLSARHFVHELTDELANLRAKFKLLRSLQGLVAPGFLTTEYLAGRRQALLTPIKVYLLCAAIFFVSAPFAGFRLAAMIADDTSGDLARMVSARAAGRGLDGPLVAARFDGRVQSVYTITLGAGAILIALLLQTMFRKKRWPYGAHLVFALHYTAFMYLVTAAAGASHTLGASTEVAVVAALAVIATYLAVALKRVYLEPNGLILLKAAAVLMLTMIVNNIASTVAIRLTLALV